MKAGRINRIKAALLLAGILLGSMPARAGLYDYSGSWVLKLNALGITESDIGLGLAAEYRFHRFLSFQLEAGYAAYGQEDLSIRSLNAYSLRPEIRIYLPHPGRKNSAHVDLYTGLELTFKHARTHFSEWQTLEDNQGNLYKRLADYRTKNLSLGPIFRFGMQLYIGPSRNFVADLGFGIGPSFNQVSHTGDLPLDRSERGLDIDVFSFNKYSGIYAHAQLDLRIGYRF